MSKKPDRKGDFAAELVGTALKAYLTEIEPEAPREKRYLAAMIRNALAIALRQLEADSGEGRSLVEQLSIEGVETDADLAKALREGEIALNDHPELLDLMIKATRAEVALTNPRAYERDMPFSEEG